MTEKAIMEHSQPFEFEPEVTPIPACEFLMGSDPQKDALAEPYEHSQHTLCLPDYHIAKTPVTNAQYAAFVQATGYHWPVHWVSGKPPSGREDHPVVNVSWYDAIAYCRWLSKLTGNFYRLPSEAEWEKGARGSDGRIYPWGNQWDVGRCNSVEDGQGDTTPVGAYPLGVSPYGLLDMAGNVFEWTQSLWGKDNREPDFKYPYNPRDGREDSKASDDVLRVLRGGAFHCNRGDVRCAYRFCFVPNLPWPYGGFRVVAPGSSL